MEIHSNITGSFLNEGQSSQSGLDKEHGSNLNQCRLNYFYAVELARRGSYKDAELLLLEAGRQKVLKPAVLDLRAKMFAQQGRYAEAEKCWLEALSLDPGKQQYRQALDTLAANRRYSPWFRPIIVMVVAIIVMAGIYGIFTANYKLSDAQYNSLKQQIVDAEKRLFDRNTSLQQQFVEFEETLLASVNSLSDKVVLLKEEYVQFQKVLEAQSTNYDSLHRQIVESEKTLAGSIESLSHAVSLLEEENAQLQRTHEEQSANYGRLQQRVVESERTLLASIEGLSHKVDLLEKESTRLRKALEYQSTSNDNWIAELGKILFAPINFVFNLGKNREIL